MQTKKINIAIDGHSSTGKSTLAKALAQKLGYIYIDTGAMYRAVTLYALRNGLIRDGKVCRDLLVNHLDKIKIHFQYNNQTGQAETFLNGENVEDKIREMEISKYVSQVAEIPEVRKKLVQLQQQMAAGKGYVMDGRDIGTVVMPDAELKIFMTASPEIRAKRRWKELRQKGNETPLEKVMENLNQRDKIDSQRETSPLIKTPDAVELDNSHMNREEQLDFILNLLKKRFDLKI